MGMGLWVRGVEEPVSEAVQQDEGVGSGDEDKYI